MTYTAYVDILPLDEILDPAGKATALGLHNLGFGSVQDVRIGRRVLLKLEAASVEAARTQADEAARKLLANLIMERYEVTVQPA